LKIIYGKIEKGDRQIKTIEVIVGKWTTNNQILAANSSVLMICQPARDVL